MLQPIGRTSQFGRKDFQRTLGPLFKFDERHAKSFDRGHGPDLNGTRHEFVSKIGNGIKRRHPAGVSFLLQVFVDSFRLAQEEWRILARGFNRPRDQFQMVLEFFGELAMLLIPPTAVESVQLTGEGGQPIFEFIAELGKLMGKPPKLGGIDNRLGHGRLSNNSELVRWNLKRPLATDFVKQVGLQQNKRRLESLHDFQIAAKIQAALSPHL